MATRPPRIDKVEQPWEDPEPTPEQVLDNLKCVAHEICEHADESILPSLKEFDQACDDLESDFPYSWISKILAQHKLTAEQVDIVITLANEIKKSDTVVSPDASAPRGDNLGTAEQSEVVTLPVR